MRYNDPQIASLKNLLYNVLSMKDNTALIKTNQVTKIFRVQKDNIVVLYDVNIEIKKNEFTVIWGPSGCGKSTLLHILIGLETPTTGRVTFLGQKIYNMNDDERADFRKRNIGMLYQQQNWIKSLNVVENVAFPLIMIGMDKIEALSKATKALEKVDMSDWKQYSPTELSAGQQQKIGLARALITDPKIIIADEPTGNLDHKSGKELMSLLKQLHKEGKTVIMVTHDINNIKEADRIIHMFDGQIIGTHQVSQNTLPELKKTLLSGPESVDSLKKVSKDIPSDFIKPPQPKVSLKTRLKRTVSNFIHVFKFIGLIVLYFTNNISYRFYKLRAIPSSIYTRLSPSVSRVYNRLKNILESKGGENISNVDLIDISFSNMIAKKSRTLVTIGGMMLGISVIVLLVSTGYGLEELVISRVATLKEIQQVDALPAVAANISITDESLDEFEEISGVKEALPMISMAGKFRYQGSSTDVVVYGVQSKYLEESSIQPSQGTTFDNNDLSTEILEEDDSNTDTDTGNTEIENTTDDSDNRYIAETIVSQSLLNIMGITDDPIGKEAEITFTETGTIQKAELVEEESSESEGEASTESGTESTGESSENTNETDPEEQSDDNETTDGLTVTYKIVGVIPDSKTPVIYVPIIDMKKMGIMEYSQVKIIMSDQDKLPLIRQQVESKGFKTTSVVDTVVQIEQIFSTARIALWLVGMTALSVAALGMFNTLTVSLLERTREVGFMKAIGMKSQEVYNLFITESMTMGVLGGLSGLALGYSVGKFISLILSTISIMKGFGTIDITALPLSLVVMVIFISVFIGMITGIFPARRATKISALDALRYE